MVQDKDNHGNGGHHNNTVDTVKKISTTMWYKTCEDQRSTYPRLFKMSSQFMESKRDTKTKTTLGKYFQKPPSRMLPHPWRNHFLTPQLPL